MNIKDKIKLVSYDSSSKVKSFKFDDMTEEIAKDSQEWWLLFAMWAMSSSRSMINDSINKLNELSNQINYKDSALLNYINDKHSNLVSEFK